MEGNVGRAFQRLTSDGRREEIVHAVVIRGRCVVKQPHGQSTGFVAVLPCTAARIVTTGPLQYRSWCDVCKILPRLNFASEACGFYKRRWRR